jgi:hypothetical protein
MVQGTGTFGAGTSYGVAAQPYGVIAGDYNGDGKPDIAAVGSTSNVVSILLNTGASFTASATYPVGTFPVALAGADLNGDGKLDAVVANQNSAGFAVLLNAGCL